MRLWSSALSARHRCCASLRPVHRASHTRTFSSRARPCFIYQPRSGWHKNRWTGRRYQSTKTPSEGSAAHAPPIPSASNQPPYVVRAALVGSTVGLATPVFATAGVVMAWYRWLPRSEAGRAAKVVIALAIGGGGYKLVTEYAWPFLTEHGDLLLPFAVSNAVSSGVWYGLLEAWLGLDLMAGLIKNLQLPGFVSKLLPKAGVLSRGMPIGGPLVGAATSLTACLLWPLAIKACWGDEMQQVLLGPERDPSFLVDAYYHIAVPVALPTGIAAGLGAHLLLAPVLLGRMQTSWPKVVVPVVGGIVGLSAFYFYRAVRQHSVADLYWINRFDDKTGEMYSLNLRDGRVLPTASAGVRSAATRWTIESFHHLRGRKPSAATPAATLAASLPAQDADVPYRSIEAWEQLSQTVDLLVRAKRLQLERQRLEATHASPVERELCQQAQAVLELLAKAKASVTGVNGLLESLELLVVMDRRVQRIKEQALQHPEDERAAAALREAARDFDHVYQQMRKHGQGGDVLSLLGSSHLGVLERGLRERLGYELSDDSAQAYERQKRRRTVITAVLGAAAAGLALGPLVTMLAAAWGKDAR